MTEDKVEEVETKPVEKEVRQYEVVEVTTQTAPAIQTPEGNFITDSEAIVMLLNEMKEVKNLVG